jgi:hypothetical protein
MLFCYRYSTEVMRQSFFQSRKVRGGAELFVDLYPLPTRQGMVNRASGGMVPLIELSKDSEDSEEQVSNGSR